MTPLEKTYCMRLAYLRGKIAGLVEEWREEARESKAPGMAKFRNYYASELEKKLKEFSVESQEINFVEIKE